VLEKQGLKGASSGEILFSSLSKERALFLCDFTEIFLSLSDIFVSLLLKNCSSFL
jgi:hypothetical protein